MAVNVVLLRGINLGARNRVAMADLRKLVEDLGGEDVETYVQSGNVVFRSGKKPAELERAIRQAIEAGFGLDVTVVVRTASQLAKVIRASPFGTAEGQHITFLAEKPRARRVHELEQRSFDPDEFRVIGREVYLHLPHGYGGSKLSNAFFEKELAVRATTRNWRTVTALAELAGR
jgi:uncharacterized protein (DUF1697 family)